MTRQTATAEQLKDILNKVARKEPLGTWEWDEYQIWLSNQVDQTAAIEKLQESVQALSGVMGTITPAGQPRVTKISQICRDLGDMIAGRFIAPSSTSTSTEPTNAGFTGTAMSGDGEVFGSDTYHIVGVNAGALQFGLSATDGKAYAGAGAVILDANGLTIQADETGQWVTFKDENGTVVATIFQDGAGNLQFLQADSTKNFTFNRGAVICLANAGDDPAFSLHENDVLKANTFWDASDLNLVLANYINTGGVVLAVNPTSGGGAGLWVLRDGTASIDRFQFSNDGGFGIYEIATDPAYVDGYAILYQLNTGTVKLRVKQGAAENEYTLSGTCLVIEGADLLWNSATSLSVTTGHLWAENGDEINITSALTASSLSLSNSTWYHVYVYLSTGTPTMEVVTTAPAAWKGQAYSKTGDTSRRYVGSVKTNASGNVLQFIAKGNIVKYLIYSLAAPSQVLSGGVATSETSVDCSGIVPVTSRLANMRIFNAVSSPANASMYTGAGTGASDDSVAPPTTGIVGVAIGGQLGLDHPLSSTQTMSYAFGPGTPSAGGGYIEVFGYVFDR